MKKTLYIFQSGQLKRKDNSLYFENDEMRKHIPIEDTNDIFIFGEIDVSKKFLEFIAQKEVCVHYFNHYGYYVGTFYPREHLNSGHIILKQAEHYLEHKKRLQLARTFIAGSMGQVSQVLKYYRSRVTKGREEIGIILDGILNGNKKLDEAQSVEELMSVEGHTREKYYGTFDFILNNPDFVFERRSKQPPHNRLNALISFGNSICYTTCLSEIYKTYLDPRIGFLHATNFRRFSLNLDVAEIFKPLMVDRLIFKMINKNMLTIKDFDQHTDRILLSESGRKKFITELDNRMKTTVNHRHLGKSVSYRRLIRLELYKIQKHIMGEKEYKPYQSLW